LRECLWLAGALAPERNNRSVVAGCLPKIAPRIPLRIGRSGLRNLHNSLLSPLVTSQNQSCAQGQAVL
jgi:hypothetical protein